MDVFMASATDHEGFASPDEHLFHPYRLLFSPCFLQISQLANMMDLYALF